MPIRKRLACQQGAPLETASPNDLLDPDPNARLPTAAVSRHFHGIHCFHHSTWTWCTRSRAVESRCRVPCSPAVDSRRSSSVVRGLDERTNQHRGDDASMRHRWKHELSPRLNISIAITSYRGSIRAFQQSWLGVTQQLYRPIPTTTDRQCFTGNASRA